MLVKGLGSTYRNPTAHDRRLSRPVTDEERVVCVGGDAGAAQDRVRVWLPRGRMTGMNDQWLVPLTATLGLASTFGVGALGFLNNRGQVADQVAVEHSQVLDAGVRGGPDSSPVILRLGAQQLRNCAGAPFSPATRCRDRFFIEHGSDLPE